MYVCPSVCPSARPSVQNRVFPAYYHIFVIRSPYHTTNWLKSFSVPSQGFRHILSRLPLLQGSLPQNKWTTGNNFLRPTCQWRSNLPSSSKAPVSWKQKLTCKDFLNFFGQFLFSGVEKWNVPNHLKRVIPKKDGQTDERANGKTDKRNFLNKNAFLTFLNIC